MTGLKGACAEYTINRGRAVAGENLTLAAKKTEKKHRAASVNSLSVVLPSRPLSYDRQHLRTVRWHGYHQPL